MMRSPRIIGGREDRHEWIGLGHAVRPRAAPLPPPAGALIRPFNKRESERIVTEPETTTVELNGFSCRVWRQGKGPKLGFLAGFGGLPRPIPFLDRLARSRTLIVPSLPGFPGGDRGHSVLDSHLDWVLAVRLLLLKAGLEGADLAGSTVGGSFAAEVAALWPSSVRRLALIAPWGLFDEKAPMVDPWAQRPADLGALLCARPERWDELKAAPEGTNSPEWPIEQTRANEAAARAFWPLGNTRIEKRLSLVAAPTLILQGAEDRLMPQAMIARFAAALGGPSETRIIPRAGHLAELDAPEEVADAILAWTS